MVCDPTRSAIVDYLGTHQHLAVTLAASVDPDGALRLRSEEQRFYEGIAGFRFPLALSGVADLRESYDDARQCFTIDVRVTNRRFGRLFSYRGEFTCTYPAIEVVPSAVKPLREERRT